MLIAASMMLTGGCTTGSRRPSVRATTVRIGSPTASGTGAALGATAPEALPNLVDRVAPSVVTVLTDAGLGSGVVYRADGVIVTNAHVVGAQVAVQVALSDGRRYPGTVTATDPVSDLAVIRAPLTSVPTAAFQRILPRQGSFVMAIGSPLGLTATVTTGVVSGLNRRLPGSDGQGPGQDLIQTDAAISPGSSGGALIDGAGRVIGVTEAYIPPQEGAVSLGFAIPADAVVDVVNRMLTTGR